MKKIDMKLKINTAICEMPGCFKRFSERHHLFSDTRKNRELYGGLLDEDENIFLICGDCHDWKPLPKFTEIEFCNALGIEPRSKVAQSKKRFG